MGLRRAAGGLLQILLAGILEGNLFALFKEGLAVHRVDGPTSDELVERLYTFHLERLSSIFAARTDLFQAVAAVRPTSPMDFRDRLLALRSALDRDDATRLVAFNKRIQNILRRVEDSEPPPGRPPDGEPPASQALDGLVTALECEIPERLAQRDFVTVLERLLDTGYKLERFFAEVLVMDPDTQRRLYRIALLKRLDRIMHAVAALEKIHVPGSTS
jgi:glycyl-tRNA synthetase beta chain